MQSINLSLPASQPSCCHTPPAPYCILSTQPLPVPKPLRLTFVSGLPPLAPRPAASRAYQQVLGLDVPVHYVVLMAPGHSLYKLAYVLPDLQGQARRWLQLQVH